MIAEKGPIMAKAATRLLEISEDEHTRHRLESYRRFEMDNRVMLKEARTEGIEVGMEKGMVEEREKLIALIEKGVPLDEIKKILSEKQPSKDT